MNEVTGDLGRDLEHLERQAKARPWFAGAILDKHGQPMPIVANVLLAMRAAPELSNVLAYDELLRAAVLVAEPPLVKGARHAGRDPLPRPVIDEDVTQVQEWLQWNSLPRIGLAAVHQAVDLRARESTFHRLREWLDGLRWDGKPRLNGWLSAYLGAEPSDYHAAIGRMFLIAMVARVFAPGCKCDYVIILEGPQGELKSAACRVLGGEWFSDAMPDIRSKDANQHVRGLWLIELPELSALQRADIEAWKAFITRETERYRPFYGRREIIEPRQCLFIGTTNKSEYLQDETGNRRFWPVLVGAINLDALKHDRDQLFAEAVYRFRAGEQWWPDKQFERKVIAPEQEERVETDVWQPVIEAHLAKLKEDRVLVCDIARDAVGFETAARIGTADQRRIIRVLRRLGWRQGKREAQGRYYHRPET